MNLSYFIVRIGELETNNMCFSTASFTQIKGEKNRNRAGPLQVSTKSPLSLTVIMFQYKDLNV